MTRDGDTVKDGEMVKQMVEVEDSRSTEKQTDIETDREMLRDTARLGVSR